MLGYVKFRKAQHRLYALKDKIIIPGYINLKVACVWLLCIIKKGLKYSFWDFYTHKLNVSGCCVSERCMEIFIPGLLHS